MKPSLTHTFQNQASTRPTPSLKTAPPKNTHSTSQITVDGAKKQQSGGKNDRQLNNLGGVKQEIKNDRHILNKHMDGIKAEVRECMGIAAQDIGINPADIHDQFAKSSPEIALAVDIVAPMAIQIADAMNEIRKGSKSLSSKQVAQIADRAATLYNDRHAKPTAQSAPEPLDGGDMRAIMADTFHDPQLSALDAAEHAASEKETGLSMIDIALGKREILDTDANALTPADLEAVNFEMSGQFKLVSSGILSENANTVARRFGHNMGQHTSDIDIATPKDAFTLSA